MEKIYYNPANPASFGGVTSLVRAVKSRGGAKSKVVKQWLSEQDAYTLHKPVRKRFPRNRYTVFRPNELWQADLNDMRGLSVHNDGINYLLTVVDAFSKQLFVKPLVHKTGVEMIEAFREIFDKDAKTAPRCLQTDKGTEFTGAAVKRLFKDYNVRYVTTQNPDVKAALVERVNRTLKTRMWRYLTYKNTYRYIDVLKNLVDSYNNSPHTSLGHGLTPNDIVNSINNNNNKRRKKKGNADIVFRAWRHMYGSVSKNQKQRRVKPKYKAGDSVRIAKEKGTFSKGYETNWSKEVFVVDREFGSFPIPLYTLRDLKDVPLVGRFYEHELQRVTLPADRLYQIEQVLETKGRGRNRQHLVKWVGYGEEFNSWVPDSRIEKLQ